jgi:iron complex outermembrane recepter protein
MFKIKTRPVTSCSVIALTSALAASGVVAQQDDLSDSQEEVRSQRFDLEEVIITGTASTGITALETSFGVSTVSREDMMNNPSPGVAGLLDSVPGLFGESSGGEVNANLSARGVKAAFMSYISLQEDGLPVMYNGFLSETEIRHDSTFERVEVIRGGPSGIFAPNGGAAIVNFISRMPEEEEGDVTVSVTDYGTVRTDFFYGGPISGLEDWYGTIGGFYRQGESRKNVEYDGDHGGQIRASLKKVFEDGSITFSYKHIDDSTVFYLPVPVASNGDRLKSINGFDASTDTLYSGDLKQMVIKTPNGNVERDMENGQSSKTDQFSVKFEREYSDGWRMQNHVRISRIKRFGADLRNYGNNSIVSASDYLNNAQQDLVDYAATLPGAAPITDMQLVRVSDGAVISNPDALNGNGLLTTARHFLYTSKFENVFNDFRLTHETDSNSATIGLLYINISAVVLYFTWYKPLISDTQLRVQQRESGLNYGAEV